MFECGSNATIKAGLHMRTEPATNAEVPVRHASLTRSWMIPQILMSTTTNPQTMVVVAVGRTRSPQHVVPKRITAVTLW
jgi:hypothetical protein